MKNTSQYSFGEKLVNGLKKATAELEEFRLQAALGKADAKDIYEESKKKFDKYVYEAKINLDEAKGVAKTKSKQLKAILETLQVQLALGKAETKEAFELQRKKIEKSLNNLEDLIKKNKTADEYYTKLLLEVGKFRIKLNILKLKYELNKLEARVEFNDKKKELAKKLSDVKKRIIKNEEEAEEKWEHFKGEIADTYSFLKKTVSMK